MNQVVFAILCLLMSWQVQAWPAKVVGVHDGDSITVLREGNVQVKIRLEGIDAPELKQPFGNASKKALSDLVFGKSVEIDDKGKDRYGRTLANVFVGKLWINLVMVESGMAWHFIQYNKEPEYRQAERISRESRLGIWSQPNPIPPWEWRKQSKKIKK